MSCFARRRTKNILNKLIYLYVETVTEFLGFVGNGFNLDSNEQRLLIVFAAPYNRHPAIRESIFIIRIEMLGP